MIQPLRRRHLMIWTAMFVLLTALFFAGIVLRQSASPDNTNLRWERLP